MVLNATVGSSTTGAITINGALSGSGNIALGTGGLTVTQSTSSTLQWGDHRHSSGDPEAGTGAAS